LSQTVTQKTQVSEQRRNKLLILSSEASIHKVQATEEQMTKFHTIDATKRD